jgi:molybdate transport system substrate-binding protein
MSDVPDSPRSGGHRPDRRVVAVALALLLALGSVLASCGSDDDSSSSGGSALTGDLTVFGAASLTEAFEDAQKTLESSDPDLNLTYSFGGSQDLVQQIRDGAPADVFASADEKNMQKLVDDGLVDQPEVFARNTLAIAVEPGNPKDIKGLDDLSRSDVTVVLADPSVPVGRYSQQVLGKAGVTVKPASLELDVKATLAKVTSGEADAAIVYRTDVESSGGKADAVDIPDDQNVIATYPIAVVKASGHKAAARAYVDEIVSGSGQDALKAKGFLPPS